MDKDPSLR
jgi:hypothetical protein